MILRRPSFDRAYDKLTPAQKAKVDLSLARLEQNFGHPREHSGIGVRLIGHFLNVAPDCNSAFSLWRVKAI